MPTFTAVAEIGAEDGKAFLVLVDEAGEQRQIAFTFDCLPNAVVALLKLVSQLPETSLRAAKPHSLHAKVGIGVDSQMEPFLDVRFGGLDLKLAAPRAVLTQIRLDIDKALTALDRPKH